MTAELSLDEEARRGDIIRKILETPEFLDAVQMTKAMVHEEWEHATTTTSREEHHATIRGIERLMNRLRGLADSGEHARHTMTREARAAS